MVGVVYTVYIVGTVNKTTAKSINNERFAAVFNLKINNFFSFSFFMVNFKEFCNRNKKIKL
jgi:hypothetical protein